MITDANPPAIVPVLGTGTVIDGRYRLEARLGAGGGGAVWRCTDTQLGEIVALKVIDGQSDLERWRREVAMARRIADRHVCRVHDLGEADGIRFVTMELVEGESLRSKLSGGGSPALRRELFLQVVRGVAAIHAAGVIHRDLKPDNVVVDKTGRAVIVDFGLARDDRPDPRQLATTLKGGGPAGAPLPGRPQLTMQGDVLGTPKYMAPEQAAGERVDMRADVWALGLIGHEVAIGLLPELDVDGGVVSPAVAAVWPDIAPILARCLALDPKDRFADAREVLLALEVVAENPAPTGAPIDTLVDRPSPEVRGASTVGDRSAATVNERSGGSRQPVLDPRAAGQPSAALRGDAGRVASDRAPMAGNPAAAPVTRRRWPLVVGAIAIFGGAAVATFFATRRPSGTPAESPTDSGSAVAERRPNPSSTAPARLTTNHAVGSLAIALDGKRYAYTIGTEIWTADVTGGSATRFRTPIIETPRKRDLISIRVGGWFADGSLAVIGTTYDGKSQVLRAWPDRNELIETVDGAVQVAVLGDRIAVASGDALWLHEAGERHEQLKLPEGQIARLAWAADGKRLAFVVRISGEPERVAVETVATRAYHNVWSDDLLHRRTDRLLAWDGDRVLVSTQDSSGATLLAIDPVTREATARTTWPGEHVRGGAAAAGVLLVLRGNARSAVMVDELGMKPLHDAGASGSQLAGWTTDGRVVFVEGEGTARHIVRAEVGATEAWPATSAVDEPDTLANDVLLVHHLAVGDKLVIDRIARDGSRKELVRVAGDPALVRPVRCAGDRAPPCIVGQVEADHVQWTELDLETGALGNVVAERSRGSGDFAAVPTPDGTRIATVDGGPVISTLDRGTGEVTRLRGYGGAAFLEIGCRDDKCFATARGFEGRASSYVRAGIALSAESRRDDQREYVRVAPGPDRTIAVELVTYELDVWRQ